MPDSQRNLAFATWWHHNPGPIAQAHYSVALGAFLAGWNAAAAAERQRIRQVAAEKGAVYRTGSRTQRHFAPFADLLADWPAGRATDGGTP